MKNSLCDDCVQNPMVKVVSGGKEPTTDENYYVDDAQCDATTAGGSRAPGGGEVHSRGRNNRSLVAPKGIAVEVEVEVEVVLLLVDQIPHITALHYHVGQWGNVSCNVP